MDYHSLPRKQLQALCKKHDIPANQTNVQMADALTTLLKAEGKPKSDANAGKMQSVRVESGREKSVLTTSSNVPKATRSNKDAVKSTEQEGCEEHVASVEDVESNEGAKIVKTRARGLPKLVPESKEHEDEIDGTARKHCRGTQRERTCKNSDSDLSIVDVTSKKMDNKKKTSASGMKDEVVDEKARENIEGHQGLKVEETLQVQENDGKHLRQPKKKTMPEEQTKPKVVDVGTKRTRAGKHPAVATESSVKDVEREEEDRTNKFEPSCENRGKKAQETGKLPVIIDIVDSDDEEVVKDWAKNKDDKVDVSVEPTVNPSESLKPVVTVNGSESPKQVVTRKGRRGGHKKEEVLKTSTEQVKINAACVSVEPTSNSSECLKQVVTLRGQKCSHKEEKVVTASSEEDKVDVADEPAVNQRGRKGGKKEELILSNSIEEANNIVTDVPVEATANASESPKQVVTRKGRKGEHKKEVLKASSEVDKVNAVCVSVEPTLNSLKCLKQVVTRRGQKCSHKEEKVVNASSKEDKVDVSDEPVVNQRGQKGGKKEELIVIDSVEEAKNIVTDVPVEATVNASESPKRVVTRKGRKDEHKKEVLKTGSEEDKVNEVCVSVEPTSSSLECLKQVVTRRGQKCSHKEEKVVNDSSEEDKVDVSDEPAVNQRGQKGGKKEELIVTDSVEEAKNIVTDVPVEATVNASESPKRVVTRKGRKDEHKKEVLKTGSEENKVNEVCVSVEPTSSSLECLKQVVTRRGQKCSHKEEKVVNASSEEDKVDVSDEPAVNRRGRKGGQKKELIVTNSAEEAKIIGTDVPVEVTVNASKSSKRVVTRKGCKSDHKKGEVLKADSEEDKVNADCVSVELTLNSSECLKQIVAQRGEKCSQELLVTDSIEEAKNNTTDISVEDNVNASESPKRLVTRRRCKVLDASAKESKVDPVSIPVKLTVNSSETPKHVVTRRGRANTQEGRKVVTVNASECLKQVVTRRGEKCSQKESLVTDSIEEAKKTSDISVEDNMNASESPKRVDTRQRCKVGHEKVMNASAKESKVDPVNIPVKFTRNCSETPKHVVTRRGRINRQEEVLETNIVEEAKNNVTNSPVEASVNFEDDASVEVSGNPSSKHVTHKGRKSWFKEELVNASSEENKVDAIGMSVESIEGQGESSSEADESDGKEKKADFRNLNDKNYGSKIKTKRTQQRQKPGKNLQGDKGNIKEEDKSDEKQKQSSSDTHRGLQKKTIHAKPDIRKSSQQEDLVQTEGHIDGALPSSTSGSYCLHEAEAGEIVQEIIDRDNQPSSTEVVEMKENKDSHRNLQRKANAPRSQTRRSQTIQSPMKNEDKKSSHQNTFPDNHQKNVNLNALEEVVEENMEGQDSNFMVHVECSPEKERLHEHQVPVMLEALHTKSGADYAKIDNLEALLDNVPDIPDENIEVEQSEEEKIVFIKEEAGSLVDQGFKVLLVESEFISNDDIQDEQALNRTNNVVCQIVNEENGNDMAQGGHFISENKKILAGKNLMVGNTGFDVDNLNESLESIKEKPNKPHDDSVNDQEDEGDSENKSEEVYSSSDLAAKDDEALEEQTVAGDGMIAGSTVFVDNILDKSLESLEKDSILPCEVGIDSAVNEEDANELRDSSNCEDGNFNDVKEKELYLIRDLEISPQKASYNEAEESGECHTGETSAVNDNLQDHLSYVIEEANLSGTPVKKLEHTSSSNLFSCSSNCEEDNFNDVKEKELYLIRDLEISPQKASNNEAEESGECHNGETSVVNDGLQDHLSYVIEEASLSGTPVKKLEHTSSSNISSCSGMNDSAVEEERQETLPTDPCKESLYESDTSLKISELIKGHKELCTPLKKAEFTSSTNVSPWLGMDDFVAEERVELPELDTQPEMPEFTKGHLPPHVNSLFGEDTPLKKTGLTGMDDSASEWSQEVHVKEDCKLKVPEMDSPSKTLELQKCHGESLFLDTLFGEGTPLKKCELTNTNAASHSGMDDSAIGQSEVTPSTEACKIELSESDAPSKIFDCTKDNDFSFSPCLNIFDTPLKKPVLQSSTGRSICSGMDDFGAEHNQEVHSTEACKLVCSETFTPSKIPELAKDNERTCLDTLFVEDISTFLKKPELASITNMSHISGMGDSDMEQSRKILPQEASKNELSQIDDSSVEKSGDIFSTETCKLETEPLELNSPSKMPELTKDHDRSPSLNTLFVDKSATTSKNFEHTNSTGMSPCGIDDSAVEQSRDVLPAEACKLELSELNAPSEMPELSIDGDRSPCLKNLSVEINDTSLKTPKFTRGVNDSAAEQSGDVLSTEVCKLDLSKLSTPSKMAEVTEDHDISPCLETLFVDDMPLFSEMDDSTVDQNVGVLPTEACKLELSELDTSSKMPEVTEDQDRSPCLNTLFLEDIGVNDSAAEQSGDVLSTEICKLDLSKLSTPSKMAEVTEDHDISPCLETLFVDDMPLFSEMDDSTVDQNVDVLPTEACKLELSELDSSSKMSEVTKDQDRSPVFNTLFLEDIGNLLKKTKLTSTTHVQCCSVMNDSVLEQNQTVLALEVCKQKYNEFDNPLKMSEFTKDHSLSPCLNMLAEDFGDISPCSGINDSAAEQSGGVLSPENCKLDLSKLSTPSKMVELTEDYDRSPCLETLFVDDMPLLSEMNDSTVDQKADVLPTEACKLELSELDTSSKMPEVTRDQDRSPCLNTLFPEDIGNLLKKTEHTSSAHIECCSVMNDSVLEQSPAVLPLDKHKQECYEFDNPLKVSELTKDHSLSPCLNMLAEDSGDISPSSGINGSAAEQSGYVLSPETCKLDLSKLSTPSKMAELSEDHDISPCLETLFVDDMSLLSGMEDSTIEQSVDVLPTEACKREISELDTLSKMPEVTKDQDRSPCLNTLFLEDIGNLLKKTASSTHVQCCSIMNDSVLEQSQPVLPLEVCKQECYVFDNSLKVSELTKDHSLSPCLNMLAEDSGDISRCSGINDSAAEQSGDALSTETCKLDLSKLSTPSKMAELTDEHDISSCFETLFVDDMPLLSEMEDSTVDQSMDVLPTEACKKEISKLDTSSKMPEVTKDQDRSPCFNTLFPEDTGNLLKKTELTSSTHVQCCSVMNDSVLEQCQAVLPLEVCKQECYEFDNPLKVSELTEGHSLSPCLNMLAGDFSDISPCSGINDSAAEWSEDVLSTETCKLDLSKLSTPSKMAEITEEHDISPCLETLFVDDMPLLSDMDDSTVDQSVDVLPTEACKRELSDGADFGLHKTLEIHRTEDSNHELSRMYTPVMRQSSSTPSEGPKLADIDDLLMIDDYAPEQNSEILPTEASKLQCCQLDTRLKMGDPSEGHDNPGFQSRPAVESDLTKLSLRQLRRLYKEKQIKQKELGKVIGKHPVSQDLSSNVYAEESSSVRNPEQSRQDCMTDLQCNIEVSRINTSLNEPEIAEGSEKLDKPEEFSTGSNYVVHQTSPAGIRLPEMTNSYKVSPCSGINASVLEQNQQACQTDLCFNNQPSQVNTPLNKPEATEAYAKLHSDEDYDTESNGVLHQTSVAGVRLQEHTPLIKPELAEGCNRPAQPEQYSTSLKNSECTDHVLLCQSPAAGIMTSETVFADESKAFEEEPFLPNNSVESGLFVEEYNVCKMTAISSKVESRIPTLADRLQILRDRLQTIQSNLQGQTPELSYATPLRKGINRKSIGSAKRSRVPMSVGRSNLAFEGDKLASTKENPIDRTHLSLKRDQISYKENQIKSKDSEKVVGKRPALKNLSLNVLEQRVDFVGQSDKRLFHIHEEDCS